MSPQPLRLPFIVCLAAGMLLVAGAALAQSDANPSFVPVAPIAEGESLAKRLPLHETVPETGQPAPLSDADLQIVSNVWTDPGDVPVLQITGKDGKKYDLPLKHTHVSAEVSGFVGRVEVAQTYQNPFTYPIEAIYVFPLPENSAVDDMKIVIGERVIEAEIKRRADARKTYEDAKAAGYTAALLEQERPNVFTQSVANIAPGEDIKVLVRYVQDLAYDAGEYEFVFPMVVGPRFTPGNATGQKSGSGWAMDIDVVPDASRVTPPIVGGGMRSGHDISLSLKVDAGLPIRSFSTPTHQIAGEIRTDGVLDLVIAEAESIPNRDFVLRYSVVGKELAATVLSHHVDGNGYLSLIVQPPDLDIDTLVGDREIIFVVDVSGSMRGKPLAMCKDAMGTALAALRPTDTFNVISFAGASKKVFDSAHPANNTNLRAAAEFIDAMRSGGGTQLADAIAAALSPQTDGRNRYVVFMTDGYVSNELQILAMTELYVDEVERQGLRARVFGFGVGSSTNRALLDGLGERGKGLTFYATNREDPFRAINRVMGLIDHPVMTDVTIDWDGLDVSEVYPQELPDVFASHPFIVHARYKKGGSATIRVKGTLGGEAYALPIQVNLSQNKADSSVLATLWARAAIAELERGIWFDTSDGGAWSQEGSLEERITELGLAYRIVTAYTSFVAVDRSRVVGDGSPETIVQPVDGAEDVNLATAAPRHAVEGAPGRPMPVSAAAAPPSPRREKKVKHRRKMRKSISRGSGMHAELSEDEDTREGVRTRPTSSPAVAIGGFDSRVAEQAFSAGSAAMQQCVDKAAGSGEITVRVVVSPDGSVAEIEVTGADASAEKCIRTEIKKLSFPKAEARTIIKKVLRIGKGAWMLAPLLMERRAALPWVRREMLG